MSAYRTLAELLLEEAEAEPIISRIPTASRHEHHCRVILNQILIGDPGSCPLIISLCAYPVQSWADHMRNSLDLDLFSLQKFLEEKQESYCGIVRYSRLNLQKETLTDSARMLHLTEEILNGESRCSLNLKVLKTLNAVHGSMKEDVSKYCIDIYYEASVREIIQEYGEDFRKLDQKMENASAMLDRDMKTAFHNTEYLVQIAPLVRRNAGRVKGNQIDFELVDHAIHACLSAVGTYPFEGDAIQNVLILRSQGNSEAECARIIGKSRKYIHARYEEGIRVLSSLLWGYSAREIVNNPA